MQHAYDEFIEQNDRQADEARCIELSRIAVAKGEYPFGAVIARDGQVVAEAINRTIRESDVTRHAEVLALSHAQKTIGREQLRHYTLYSNIEPCAMCSYCIREAWIGRVVYALGSPVMGGFSKWNILRDDDMSGRMAQVFGAVPEVVSGVLAREAQSLEGLSPLGWQMIKLPGLVTSRAGNNRVTSTQPARTVAVASACKSCSGGPPTAIETSAADAGAGIVIEPTRGAQESCRHG
jgi:tRNA(adenine34) deaminase